MLSPDATLKDGIRFGVAGFRVKSGRAVAVFLVGSRGSPEVVERAEVALSDPGDPSTQQPYHAAFGTLETDERRVASRIAAVRRAAERSVASTVQAWRARGADLRLAALVVGSLNPPEAIANEHIRAHALEGQLFRTVLADALIVLGVRSVFVLGSAVYREASTALSRDPEDLERAISDLGRSMGRPWRADHKLAALAAWSHLP